MPQPRLPRLVIGAALAALFAFVPAASAQRVKGEKFKIDFGPRSNRSPKVLKLTSTKVLYQGPRSTVHEAVGSDGRKVAVKVRRPRGSLYGRDEVESLSAEWNQLMNLNDRAAGRRTIRGVPRPLGRNYGEYSVVETLAPGESVAALLERGEKPSPVAAARIMKSAGMIAHRMHKQRNFGHFQIRPRHVVVDKVDSTRPKVTLVDWTGGTSLNSTYKERNGSLSYSAPELWTHDARTARTDVFGLGITLRSMLTGEVPFDARALKDAAVMDQQNGNRMAREISAGIAPSTAVARYPVDNLERAFRTQLARPYSAPAGLKAIIDKATAYDPAKRYPSARAFSAALDGWIASQSK